MNVRACLFVLCLLILAPRAQASGGGFLSDLTTGVGIPLGDSNYKKFADTSFKASVRAGYALPVGPLYFAPEIGLHLSPVNFNQSTYEFTLNGTTYRNVEGSFFRFGAAAGGRLIVPFGPGAFFLRLAFGVDHIGGTTKVVIPIVGTFSDDSSSTGFIFDPSLGVQFRVLDHLVLGVELGFPVALHDFGANHTSFTAVDLDLLAFLGARH